MTSIAARSLNHVFINVSASSFNEKIWNYSSCTRECIGYVFNSFNLLPLPQNYKFDIDSWMYDSDVSCLQ